MSEVCEVCDREKMPPCPHQSVRAGDNTCLSCGKYVSGEYVHASLPAISASLCLRGWYADGHRDKECLQRGYARLESELREARRKGEEAEQELRDYAKRHEACIEVQDEAHGEMLDECLDRAESALSAERTARQRLRDALEVAKKALAEAMLANCRSAHVSLPAMRAESAEALRVVDAALAAEPGYAGAIMVPGEVGYVHPQGALPPEGHPRATEVKNE